MNAEMIQAGAMLAGTVLSFMFLLRARRLSTELWSARPSSQPLPVGSDVVCPVEIDQEFRGQER
jgi:hypothetical protein